MIIGLDFTVRPGTGGGLCKSAVAAAVLSIVFSVAVVNICSGAAKAGGKDFSGELASGGRARTYLLHAPASYDGSKAVPLLIALHGGGGNADHMRKISGVDALSDREGFIAVYPDGTGQSKNMMLTWNAGRCCAYAMDKKVDDVGFIRDLIAEMKKKYKIDGSGIFVTGFSNGGMLAYRLACEMPDVLAAVAPVSGSLETECEPSAPVSMVIFHGTDDNNVPFEGGVGKKALVRLAKKPVSYAVSFWAEHNKCKGGPERSGKGNIVVEKYGVCEKGTEVVLYKIIGGTHSWPGGKRVYAVEDEPTAEISATETMWAFFKAHPKKK